MSRMRAWVVAAAVCAAGACKKSEKHEAAQPGAAMATAPVATAPTKPGTAERPALVRIGAAGGSIYTDELVGRADGGFVLSAEIRDQLTIGGTTVKQAGDDDMDTIIAIDGAGKVRWVRPLGANCMGVEVATHDTTTVIAGSCSDPIETPAGKVSPPEDDYAHVLVAALDDTGAVTWAKYAGSKGSSQIVSSIATDEAGNIIVGGWLFGPANFGTGTIAMPKGSTKVGFVASFDAGGKARWVNSYPSASVDAVTAAGDEVDVAASFFKPLKLAGTQLAPTRGGRLVARLDGANGKPRAAVKVGENGANEQRLARSSSGTLYLASDDLDGVVLYSIDASNAVKELHRIVSRDTCLIGHRALRVDGSGALWLATCFGKPVDFGGGPLTTQGFDDAVAVKYTADGAYVGAVPLATKMLDTPGGLAIGKDGSPVAAWFTQAGPPGKPYTEWLITETYYVAALERLVL